VRFEPIEGWGRLPEGWRFVEVAGVAVDAQDRVFCFTRGEHPVIVFDREGSFLRSWGEGLVRRAHGITIDADDMVWLTDDLHHTIRKFTPDGRLLLAIGDPDTPSAAHGGKPFNRPTHVAICPRTGSLYVSDGYGNSRVHKYAPDGRHLFSWGEPGTDPGEFNLPHNLTTDADGLVYVADRENHRIQIFDGQGRYQGQWNQLHRPCGLHTSRRENDHLYVGELGSSNPVTAHTPNIGPRVSVLNSKGERVCRFGGRFAGEKPGEFIAPHGLVVDSRGDCYVAEVSWTQQGRHETPPREIRSLQKFRRVEP
jgi:DNA-binding beta-propeller fold protein YncE